MGRDPNPSRRMSASVALTSPGAFSYSARPWINRRITPTSEASAGRSFSMRLAYREQQLESGDDEHARQQPAQDERGQARGAETRADQASHHRHDDQNGDPGRDRTSRCEMARQPGHRVHEDEG